MAEPENPKERNERHAREVQDSQKKLRNSIAETKRLLCHSDEMLKRRGRERDTGDN